MVNLRVEALDPITGKVLTDARVTVRSPSGEKLCDSYGVLAGCSLIEGEYRLAARRRDWGTRGYSVHLTPGREFKRIAIWHEAPVTHDRIYYVSGKKAPRAGRLEGVPQSMVAAGYWIKAAAVFDSALHAETYSTTPDFVLSHLPIGLYAIVVSLSNDEHRQLLLEVHDGCRSFTIPLGTSLSKITCG